MSYLVWMFFFMVTIMRAVKKEEVTSFQERWCWPMWMSQVRRTSFLWRKTYVVLCICCNSYSCDLKPSLSCSADLNTWPLPPTPKDLEFRFNCLSCKGIWRISHSILPLFIHHTPLQSYLPMHSHCAYNWQGYLSRGDAAIGDSWVSVEYRKKDLCDWYKADVFAAWLNSLQGADTPSEQRCFILLTLKVLVTTIDALEQDNYQSPTSW